MNRRNILLAAGLAAAWAASGAIAAEPAIITPKEALDRSRSGDIVLIDIRTEGEWRDSGVPETAHAISMRDEAFLSEVETLTAGDRSAKVALICATGARSAWLRERLEERGYANVIDVSQGMFGNERGPGWIEQGLPIRAYSR